MMHFSKGFVVVAAKEGSGVTQFSDFYAEKSEAEDAGKRYAETHLDEVVMLCQPVAVIDAKIEVKPVGGIISWEDKSPAGENKDATGQPTQVERVGRRQDENA
jgi:hypothetical protein